MASGPRVGNIYDGVSGWMPHLLSEVRSAALQTLSIELSDNFAPYGGAGLTDYDAVDYEAIDHALRGYNLRGLQEVAISLPAAMHLEERTALKERIWARLPYTLAEKRLKLTYH